ncbi:MAG: 5'-nucleotidase C-terminal domain-containing protein, partial [Bdellovibrionales bacterium]|nr:5'-nucleotidase C-terminal domain-containing protein [Bdellovibrionales bacterium]
IGRSLTARAYRIYRQHTPRARPLIGAVYHGGTIRIDDRLMSPTALFEVADKKELTKDLQVCQSPKNCVDLGSGRCEKIVRCPGEVTEYDVLRIAPFAESVLTWVQLTGQQIYNLYQCNDKNSGTGSYLQFSNIFRCSKKQALCTLAQDPTQSEFGPSETEVPLDPRESYTVASLDFMTHKMLLPNPRFKNAPMFPVKFSEPKSKENPTWVLQNDLRRILIEEPAANRWVARVRTEKGIENTLGYGPQPPFKNPNCN